MQKKSTKDIKKIRRTTRIRKHILETASRVRLSVFRSNAHIYAQIIDDSKAITIVSVSSKEAGIKKKMDAATAVGKLIAKKANEIKITEVVFDKGAYKYHGRVKALAEGAREGGLRF